MFKFYRISFTACILLISLTSAFAQSPGKKRHLGSTSDFSTNVRNQISSGSKLKLSVSDAETLSLKVNLKNSANAENQYLAGEVENHEAASFFLKVDGNQLSGNIILKNAKKAFKYSSDSKGNAYVEPADINSVLCIEYAQPAKATTTASSPTAAAISPAVANLQSLSGARGCVLLDFDGQYVSGTPWNNGNPINAAPSGMTDAQIQETWEVVSEDFRPFHLNVTTNESVFNTYPKTMRMRCIITTTNTAAPGAGGVAYVGSFNWNDDTPCWVFVIGGKSSGEAASHEVGHTFGLSHDGRTNPSEGYFAGHGDWAPIMGVGYYENITQWSRGEYQYANNTEDDLAKISGATWGVGYRGDDHSNSISGATALARNTTSLSGSGIITTTGDIDYFAFSSGAGTVTINANTVSRHGDLDILLRLHNSTGGVIATSNPAGLNASLSASVAAGTYYVSIDGTGAGLPASDGYSDYASLGTFNISGSSPTPTTSTGVATVYKDCNYTGYAVGLGVGDYTLSALTSRGVLNDDISSIKVNAGYQVQLFENDNFAGASVVITGENSCLVGNGWNDRASSLRVSSTAFSSTVQAESYSSMLGVQTEATTDAGGGSNVGWIDTGDWMAYNGITIPTTGSYKIEYRVASPNATAKLSSDLNAGAIQLGTLTIPNTGGWQNWTTISHTVTINAGTYNFGIYAQAGGFNINWWRISRSTGARLASSEDIAAGLKGVSLDLYPNPAAGQIFINSLSDLKGAQVKIIDRMGIQAVNAALTSNSIDLSNLKPGLYTFILTKDGKKITKRFIKE